MEKFTASRLSEGNKVFPSEIHTEPNKLTVKIPGLFGGKSQSFGYRDIASVSVSTPMVGFSTITFYAAGTKITVHGFTKAEVKQIQQIIEERKSNVPAESTIVNMESSSSPRQPRRGLLDIIHGEKSEEEKIREEERHEKNREQMKAAVKDGAKAVFKGFGNMVNSKKIKEAMDLHNSLMLITDDIDIKINQGKKEEIIEMIKNLNHPSSLNLPDESDSYVNFWTKKRKEYINKIA